MVTEDLPKTPHLSPGKGNPEGSIMKKSIVAAILVLALASLTVSADCFDVDTIVEGINMMKRHTKASSRAQAGGIVEREAPIHISNVVPWCDSANGPSKIVMKTLENGTRVRTWKINGETLDD